MITLRVARQAPARPRANAASVQDAPVTPRRRPTAPPPQAAPVGPQVSTVEDIVVTARRREERIIDVPIAVSAFSEERLETLRIDGGSELLRAIPNVNFSKDNFTGYNFSIRGIGVKALSVTADPGVAVSFNNTALLRNRLFEQEYFDVSRLEVLRGPQGTLYGRNATAGVVNMLPNLPELGEFDGEMQLEVGNHDTRRGRGFVNIPIGDTLAVRVAGAFTQRDGFDYNTVTEQNVNGRDLWATRLGVLWEPNARFRANLLWEHFSEDDNRARTGKQLCTRGEAPTSFEWTDASGATKTASNLPYWTRTSITPGCQPGSLYSDDAFGAPNGTGFPIVTGLILATPYRDGSSLPGIPCRTAPAGTQCYGNYTGPRGAWGGYLFQTEIDPFSPNSGRQSSTDLREIETFYDPTFQAENDVFQLNMELDLTPNLTLHSQTLHMEDRYYGSQDYFRLNPVGGLIACADIRQVDVAFEGYLGGCSADRPTDRNEMAYWGGGSFIDPQLGELDRLVAVDLSRSESRQFSQEFRLQSAFDGPINFNLGANYLKFETNEDYYIFSNAFTIAALGQNSAEGLKGDCTPATPAANPDPNACTYIDPNPIDQIDGEGHNYYRNINIAETESWAVFGEGYFILGPDLRLTTGLRYTDDKKTITPVPTQLLNSSGAFSGADLGRGHPALPDVTYHWREWTGRLAIDWKPDLSFTDDTLVYASYSRGYKGGGGNPSGPANGFDTNYVQLDPAFDAEFVDAFEMGVKNSLMDGRLMLSGSAFFYDYQDYQVAQVIDRTLHNENFDARIWGVEFETAWAPTRNFRIDATLGLLRTEIADGETSIDVMNRTQGNEDWLVLRPWPTNPNTCIVPKSIYGKNSNANTAFIKVLCPGPNILGLTPDRFGYDWNNAPNQGRGFDADLSGNELPNAPKMTFNVGAQYRFELPQGWDVTVRGDYYRQSDSWMRVYNLAPYDRLEGWGNANLSMTVANPDGTLTAQLYVKNLFDDAPITDGFTGPDEIGNTTNVFTLDPRIIGLSVRKSF
ncbi:MAG: TonB-dependent receptor [Brevundimonas sp.]|nr:MAG: TonB-dependent receptor [Brevundimonas sp.]